MKFTHRGKVSIVIRVVEPPSFKNRNHMKPKQLSDSECGDMFSSGIRECQSCRNAGAIKLSDISQRGDKPGAVVIASDKLMTEGQMISASSLSSRNAAEQEASANTDKDVKDNTWVEFQIVDTGIGISGTFVTNFCMTLDVSTLSYNSFRFGC